MCECIIGELDPSGLSGGLCQLLQGWQPLSLFAAWGPQSYHSGRWPLADILPVDSLGHSRMNREGGPCWQPSLVFAVWVTVL